MSNGIEMADVATEGGGKMATISKKINYLIESSKKNLNLSGEIRAKLLCTEPKEDSIDAAKNPRSSGHLNSIIDNLQDVLNTINISNGHLISVNKEV